MSIFNFEKKNLLALENIEPGRRGFLFFTVKILLLIICCVCSLYGLSLGYKTMNQDDSSYTKKFQNVPKQIEISNLGSSHGLFGFCYGEQKEEETFNFGLVSQSLDYDYRLIQQYRGSLAEGGVMFIVVSYFSLYEEEESEREDFLSKNKRYYGILSPKYIKEYSFGEHLLADILPVMGTQDNIIYELATSKERGTPAKEVWNRRLSESSPEEIRLDAENSYVRHTEHVFGENGKPKFNQRNVKALYGIIELCREKEIEPVLVTTPYLRAYTEEFRKNDPDYLEGFYEFMTNLERETGAVYLDYSSDVRFDQKYQYFWSVDHLNKEGAILFTRIVLEECGWKIRRK